MPRRTAEPRAAGGRNGRALIIEDVYPWDQDSMVLAMTNYNIPYDVITSDELAGTSLAGYSLVCYVSDQPTSYYDNIAADIGDIDAYVAGGGTLLAHLCDNGWSEGDWTGLDVLPDNVGHVTNDLVQSLHVTDPSDPVVSGEPNGVMALDDSYFYDWNYSAHGYFTDLPASATTVMGIAGETDEPVYVTYPYGSGVVRATMTTIEWGYGNGTDVGYDIPVGPRPEFLVNELLGVAPTTTVSSTFDPAVDGWGFQNWMRPADWLSDWKLWSSMFGWGVQSDVRFVMDERQGGGIFNGGVCYGMSTSAAAHYTGDVPFSSLGLSAPSLWAWGPPASRANQFGLWALLFNQLKTSVPQQKTVIDDVELFYLAQFAAETRQVADSQTLCKGLSWQDEHYGDYTQRLREWTAQLRQALAIEPQIINIRGPDDGTVEGHCLVAYKVVQSGSGTNLEDDVYLYDNNWPYTAQDPSDSTDRILYIWPEQGKWSYNLFGTTTWTSEATGNSICFYSPSVAADAVNSPVPVAFDDGEWSFADTSSIVLTDDDGNVSSPDPADQTWDIPGVEPWSPAAALPGTSGGNVTYLEIPSGTDITAAVKPDANGTYLIAAGGQSADEYFSATWPQGSEASASADQVQLSSDGQQLSATVDGTRSGSLIVASGSGAPAVDLQLGLEGTAGSSTPGVTTQLQQTGDGFELDLTNDGGLASGSMHVGWWGGGQQTISADPNADYQFDFSGGQAAGGSGASQLQVLADSDHDGDYQVVSTSTLPAVSSTTAGNFTAAVPPTTTVGGVDSAWHDKPVTATFTGSQPAGPGVQSTRYSLDGGSWIDAAAATVAAPTNHSNDGVHVLAYDSVDVLGDVDSPTPSCEVKIDTRAPRVSAYAAVVRRGRVARLRFRIADPAPSCGRANVKITIKRAGKVLKSFALTKVVVGRQLFKSFRCRLPRGTYTWSLAATDVAGNRAKVVKTRLVVK